MWQATDKSTRSIAAMIEPAECIKAGRHVVFVIQASRTWKPVLRPTVPCRIVTEVVQTCVTSWIDTCKPRRSHLAQRGAVSAVKAAFNSKLRLKSSYVHSMALGSWPKGPPQRADLKGLSTAAKVCSTVSQLKSHLSSVTPRNYGGRGGLLRTEMGGIYQTPTPWCKVFQVLGALRYGPWDLFCWSSGFRICGAGWKA